MKDHMVELDARLNGDEFTRLFACPNATEEDYLQADAIGAVAHQIHDEILAVSLADAAEFVQTLMDEVMTTRPDWAPDLPLTTEGGYAQEYSK